MTPREWVENIKREVAKCDRGWPAVIEQDEFSQLLSVAEAAVKQNELWNRLSDCEKDAIADAIPDCAEAWIFSTGLTERAVENLTK